ncbi:MAG: GNAT family N-acetyltransferase [Mycobacteriaceae bacterium]
MTDDSDKKHSQWHADVLASDGGVVQLRPIVPEDAERLVAFHAQLSERTRYLRYFGSYPTMPTRDVVRMTTVDHHDRVAFVGILGNEIIAVGLYERLLHVGDGLSAEVAFVVADAHQGRGLGPILLEHLAGAAAENGLNRFVAEVLGENRHMVTVFREAGYQVSRSYDGGIVHLEFNIDHTEALRVVRNSRERAAEARSVRNLLRPGSVAVIGASNDKTKVGHAILSNLIEGGFTGPVFPVNDEHQSIRGIRAYPTVRAIPDEVDLAVVAIPAEGMTEVLDDCLDKGVKTLVIVSSGFSETGEGGRVSEQRLVQAVRAHGMRLVGPNALGVANTDSKVALNATLASVLPHRGKVGFFCQSGALGITILAAAAKRQIGLSTFVSAGNRADLSGNDLLQYWDSDPDTEVVLLYLESVGNPRKFARIARRVARNKPVITVRGGRPLQSAVKDSPAIVMDESSVRSLFEQSGVVQVESISQLFDCAILFAYQPLPKGPRVTVIGNSTALGVLAVDAARREGLTAADPIDLGARVSAAEFSRAVRDAVDSKDNDAVIVVFVPPMSVDAESYAQAIRDAAGYYDIGEVSVGSKKPILTTFLAVEGIPDGLAERGLDGLPTRGSIPSYPGPERAALALARAWKYGQWRFKPVTEKIRPTGLDLNRAEKFVQQYISDSSSEELWLTDKQAAELLACYGIVIVDFMAVESPEEALIAAEKIGYPVALKAIGQRWQNRQDLTGVRLDVMTPEAVVDAFADLTHISGESRLHVQRMAVKGIGCVIGIQDDPTFGALISFGLAGVITELLGDRAYRVLPLHGNDAAELIESPKAAPMLSGYRSGTVVDKSQLIDLVQRVAALAEDIPEIRELSCSPILASPQGVELLSARIRVGPQPTREDGGPRKLR